MMLVNVAALLLGSALASSCDAADKKIWDQRGKADFKSDERTCALRCGGQNPCTGNCMSQKLGYSHACGQCFGGLSSCVVSHCVVAPGNCGVNSNGEACKQCTNQYCTPEFESCTGFAPPSQELTAPAKLGAPFWCEFIPPAVVSDIPECAASAKTLKAMLEAAPFWCQFIPTQVQGDIPECAASAADLSTELSASPSWCQWIPPAVKSDIPACAATADLSAELSASPSWCQWIPPAVKSDIPACAAAADLSTELSAAPFWCKFIPTPVQGDIPECAATATF